jgi:hypothetical protein
MERTFTHGSITVTVRRAKVRERLAVSVVHSKLEEVPFFERHFFARALTQSTVTGMQWATPADNAATLRAVFDAWMELDGDVWDAWQDALTGVDAPPNDPDLLPPQLIPEEKKED